MFGKIGATNETNTLGHRVRYNPYTMQQFHTVEGLPIERSDVAEFTGTGLAYVPCWEGCK